MPELQQKGDPDDEKSIEYYKRLALISNLGQELVPKISEAIYTVTQDFINKTGKAISAQDYVSSLVSSFRFIAQTYLESFGVEAISIKEISPDEVERALEIDKLEDSLGEIKDENS